MDTTDRQDIDTAAAMWVVREDRGPLTAAEQAERDRWLAASPRHFGAYARAHALLAWSGRMTAPAVKAVRRRPWRLRWPLAAAAAVVLAAGLAAGLMLALAVRQRARDRAWPDPARGAGGRLAHDPGRRHARARGLSAGPAPA